MPLYDLHDPFFRPVWRRVVVVAVTFGWAGVEFSGGTPFWGVLFGAIGIHALWQFFLVDWPDDKDQDDDPDAPPDT